MYPGDEVKREEDYHRAIERTVKFWNETDFGESSISSPEWSSTCAPAKDCLDANQVFFCCCCSKLFVIK